MQIKKNDIGKIFEKLKLEVRSTKHRYGWFTFQGRKVLRVHYSHGKEAFNFRCKLIGEGGKHV
jgi:uncharacterized protein YkuJ